MICLLSLRKQSRHTGSLTFHLAMYFWKHLPLFKQFDSTLESFKKMWPWVFSMYSYQLINIHIAK